MSSFTNGAIASPKKRKQLIPTPDPELDEANNVTEALTLAEENDLTEAPVNIGGYLPTEQIDAEVDQYSDPPESPDEYRSEFVKEEGLAGFMSKVASRMRTIKNTDQRSKARHRFFDLLRRLKIDKTAQPPYNQAAAFQIRAALEKWGLGETLLLDFEMLLHHAEELAEKHREGVEKLAQEHEDEQRKKQEWDVVNEEDAEDAWQMI